MKILDPPLIHTHLVLFYHHYRSFKLDVFCAGYCVRIILDKTVVMVFTKNNVVIHKKLGQLGDLF